MWSIALYQFRLSEETFWAMTPRNFAALMTQHKYAIRHQELLTAIIAASTVNTSFCAPEKPREFAAFMPSEWAKIPAKKPRKKRMSQGEREYIRSKVHCFLMARAVPAEESPDAE